VSETVEETPPTPEPDEGGDAEAGDADAGDEAGDAEDASE
jgi:hypothetical protein